MNLTPRRLEFLQALAELCAEDTGGVHYAAVAERLNVSKWTGYDMMQELIADGLVRSSYSTASSGFKGRSQVLFEPTAVGLNLLRDLESPESPAVDSGWQEMAHAILERATATLRCGSDSLEILSQLEDKTPLAFCAGFIAFLIVEFKRRKLNLTLLEKVLGAGIEAGSALPLMIGVLAGELLVKGALKRMPDADQRLKRFAEEISRMGDQATAMLADFARAVMKTTVNVQ